jgi:radical SAM protein with 4Fe4S-binding SPASM domain
MHRLQQFASEFVNSTRDYIFIRPEDRLVIMRPNKTQHLNATACEMLSLLYGQPQVDVQALVAQLATKYAVEPERIAKDLDDLLASLSGLLRDDFSHTPSVRMTPFGSHEMKFPVLSEIALTYRCQHKCPFCYADAQRRGDRGAEMTIDQVKVCIDRIWDEARVPTISFTGGEPTLRPDLPELVAYAKRKGMRTNLITNGFLCGEPALVTALAEAGLDSAQVSIEAPTAEAHDAITRTPGSFVRSVQGIRNFHDRGIHVHTNTTICPQNRDCVLGMVDFAADELGHEYLSMNMVIRTGGAAGDEAELLGYSQIESVALPIIARARERGLRMVWYSPVPYCLFNPVLAGIGSNSCAAADGLLSVAPDGQVLPCSSFETGVGNLLTEPFERIWNRRTARYWRNKEFMPPACSGCDMSRICCGACPLYWDERGGFGELPGACGNSGKLAEWAWKLKRRYIGKLKGVNVA